MFPVGYLPSSPNYTVTVLFDNDHLLLGKTITQKMEKEVLSCSEPMCSEYFDSVEKMLYHLNYEDHVYDDSAGNKSQLSKMSDRWVERFAINQSRNTELTVTQVGR